jgi:Leucine-rich repeat (LRR) protein
VSQSFDAVYDETCKAAGEQPDLKRCHAIMTLMAGEGLVNYNSLELSGTNHLLFENRLRDLEVRAIFAAVKDKQALQVVDLSCNNISDIGAQSICQFLHGNTTLVALALKGNDLGDEGCRLLCQAVKFNRNLKVLDISHNPIGRKGAMIHLSDLLEANEGLDDLDITKTGLDMVGAATICAAMRRNSTIQTLRMGDMSVFQTVESDLPSHIGRMLQFNSTLKSLDISKIMLRDEGTLHVDPNAL